MGERYELNIKCDYCKEKNEEVYYAPTCGFLTFECHKCKKSNFITEGLYAKKLEDATYEDIYYTIYRNSIFMGNEQIESMAKSEWSKIKKEAKTNGIELDSENRG